MEDIQYIFSVGMPRSGSTLLYNWLRGIAEASQTEWTELGYIGELEDLDAKLEALESSGTGQRYLIKFHHPTDKVLGLLHSGKARAVYSRRDIRDVAASYMSFMGLSFHETLSHLEYIVDSSWRRWKDAENLLLVEYNSIVSIPRQIIAIIAESLGVDLNSKELSAVLETSIPKGKKNPDKALSNTNKPRDMNAYDRTTLYHETHVTNGRVGRFRADLSTSEVSSLEGRFNGFLREAGYLPTHQRGQMVSYSQNFEDVLLDRIFERKTEGFYIDVGAADPEALSVTKHFYDMGWSGINIEPNHRFFMKLQQHRPRDINVNVGVGDKEEQLTLHAPQKDGVFSSFDKDTVESVSTFYQKYQHDIGAIHSYGVEVYPLQAICDAHIRDVDIDFLKIDVEKMEKEVLSGVDLRKYRPKVIIIEATKSFQYIDFNDVDGIMNCSEWEHLILSAEYEFAHFDGLNRWYVAIEHSDLKKFFAVPINLLDEFVLRSPRDIITESQNKRLVSEVNQANVQLQDLRTQLEQTDNEHAQELNQANTELQDLRTQLEQTNNEHAQELNQANTELQGLRTQLEQTNNEHAQELNQANNQLQELTLQLEQASANQAHDQFRIDSLNAECDRLRRQLDDVTKYYHDIESYIQNQSAMDRNLGRLRSHVAEMRERVSLLLWSLKSQAFDTKKYNLRSLFALKNQIRELRHENILPQEISGQLEHTQQAMPLPHPPGSSQESVSLAPPSYGSWDTLVDKLNRRQPFHVVFVNDNGFTYGAGIALMRQVNAFLNAGCRVSCVAWKDHKHNSPPVHNNFLGIEYLDGLDGHSGTRSDEITKNVANRIIARSPDLVIAGNFHAARWPPEILQQLHEIGIPTIAYLHDLFWATGGCAHPLWNDCKSDALISHCNDSQCSKPEQQYPPHECGDIGKQAKDKMAVFCGATPVPFAANSTWTESQFRKLYGDNNILIDVVPLCIDTNLFAPPQDQKDVRKMLGLEKDKFIILAGSGSLSQTGKGASYISQVAQAFSDDDNVLFVVFGNKPTELSRFSNIHAVGYVEDVNELVSFYQAVDVFLNPVTVESFGQTMLEAIACETPVVSFPVCGTTDVAIDGETAICAFPGKANELVDALRRLRNDPSLAKRLGKNGRTLATTRFALETNFIYWRNYLYGVANSIRFDDIKTSWKQKPAFSTTPVLNEANVFGLRDRGFAKGNIHGYPLVTVAMVLYNSIDEMEATILSIQSQDYPNVELIIVDGGSNDGTVEYLHDCGDSVDWWTSAPDKGIYDAMNRALDAANGEFIVFMGAGDTFVSADAVSRVMRHLQDETDIVHGHVYWQPTNRKEELMESAEFSEKYSAMVRGDFDYAWLRGLPPHQATFMRTQLARELRFDLSFTVSADWDMIFRAYASGAKFQRVDEIVANYPGGGYSATKSAQWILDVLNIVKRYTNNVSAAKEYLIPIYEHHRSLQPDNQEMSISVKDVS